MNEPNSLETQFFSWDGWDIIDVTDFYFYKPVLKVKIGDHEIGTQFGSAAFMMSNSTLEFYDEGGEIISTHKLRLTVE